MWKCNREDNHAALTVWNLCIDTVNSPNCIQLIPPGVKQSLLWLHFNPAGDLCLLRHDRFRTLSFSRMNEWNEFWKCTSLIRPMRQWTFFFLNHCNSAWVTVAPPPETQAFHGWSLRPPTSSRMWSILTLPHPLLFFLLLTASLPPFCSPRMFYTGLGSDAFDCTAPHQGQVIKSLILGDAGEGISCGKGYLLWKPAGKINAAYKSRKCRVFTSDKT